MSTKKTSKLVTIAQDKYFAKAAEMLKELEKNSAKLEQIFKNNVI